MPRLPHFVCGGDICQAAVQQGQPCKPTTCGYGLDCAGGAAKARFGALVRSVMAGDTVIISYRGRAAVLALTACTTLAGCHAPAPARRPAAPHPATATPATATTQPIDLPQTCAALAARYRAHRTDRQPCCPHILDPRELAQGRAWYLARCLAVDPVLVACGLTDINTEGDTTCAGIANEFHIQGEARAAQAIADAQHLGPAQVLLGGRLQVAIPRGWFVDHRPDSVVFEQLDTDNFQAVTVGIACADHACQPVRARFVIPRSPAPGFAASPD